MIGFLFFPAAAFRAAGRFAFFTVPSSWRPESGQQVYGIGGRRRIGECRKGTRFFGSRGRRTGTSPAGA
jgi:hypothetical protein